VTGLLVVVLVVALAAAFGLYRRATDGRLRATTPAIDTAVETLAATDVGAALGSRATLVQFSTVFCAPCRSTRVILAEIAEMLPGVRHVEVDAEANLELVRRLDVRRTPTVLVLDGAGQVRTRAAGAPRKADVIAALGQFL
jgi:thiol-disulfide isomerase/thioredoxin